MTVLLYDTTLRDGTQREGLSLSVADKLKIARELDRFGMHYIEGGWPGSNPKDAAFFAQAAQMTWQHAKIAAFGSTRRANGRAEDDANLRALLDARTPVVTLVGKSWTLHVTHVLETTLDENLAMIADSVALMKAHGKEVVYDAEHFFDGFRADRDYALSTIRAAAEGVGPVNALDQAMRKALLPCYPELADVHLVDYKVRILDSESATGATTRVLLEAAQADQRWTTVGCSANIIEASWQALADSLELPLLRARSARTASSRSPTRSPRNS